MKDNGPANTGLTLVWMPVFFENFENGRAVCIGKLAFFYFVVKITRIHSRLKGRLVLNCNSCTLTLKDIVNFHTVKTGF